MGPATADVMLIGEAPGFDEDRSGQPFQGRAGKLMARIMTETGVPKERLFITNQVRCQPPNNRDPLIEELEACSKWTTAQLELIQPKLVVTVGRIATEAWFPDKRISDVHGALTRHNGQLVMAIFHPAAALHNPTLMDALKDDFRKLSDVVKSL